MLHQNSYKNSKSGDKSGDTFKRVTTFTDVTIRHLKPLSKKTEYSCEGLSGFGIRVFPTGTKTWLYSFRFKRRQKKMSLGQYPKVSLSEAIALYHQAKEKVEQGINPLAERNKEHKKRFDEPTVNELIDFYLEHCKKSGKTSYLTEKKCFEKDIIPILGNTKISEVLPKELSSIFHNVLVVRNAPSTANHLYSYVRRLFNFAADMGMMRRRDNPCLDIKLRIKKNKRSRHLSTKEIYLFWYGLDHTPMSPVTRLALKFMLVTIARGGEVRQMKWADIDLNERIWTLPKTKNGHLHRIYLGNEALKILNEVRQYSDGKGIVFGSTGKMATCGKVKENLKSLSNRTLCQPIKRHFNTFGIDTPFIPHDLRRTGATIIAGLFGRQDLVKMCLNHVRNDVTSIYDQYTYAEEKKRAMNALNQAIGLIVSSANIESIPTFEELKNYIINPVQTPVINQNNSGQSKQGFQSNSSNPVTYRLSFGHPVLLGVT